MAKLKHALLDVDFKDKPKVLELEDRFGLAARLLFIDIICTLSKASNGCISRGAIRLLGLRCNFNSEQTTAIIDFCLKLEMLHESDLGISNSRVTKDQQNYTNKLQRDNEYQAKKKRIVSESETIPDIDIVNDIDNDDLEGKGVQGERETLPVPIEAFELESPKISDLKSLGFTNQQQQILEKAIPKTVESMQLSLNSKGEIESKHEQLTKLRLKPKQLCNLILFFQSKGLKCEDLAEICLIMNDYLVNHPRKTYRDQSAVIRGWCYSEYLKRTKTKLDLVRSENYLNKSQQALVAVQGGAR